MYRASRSETLVALIEMLYLRYAPTLYIVMELIPGATAAKTLFVHQHHIAILNALNAHDAPAARAALEEDLSAAIELDGFLTAGDNVGSVGAQPVDEGPARTKAVRAGAKEAVLRKRPQAAAARRSSKAARPRRLDL